MKNCISRSFISSTVLGFAILLSPQVVRAHCDTMDGPVVKAARKALETGNVNLVLIWVQKMDEAQIKAAFLKTLAVRKLNQETKELADMYFFETLVRIHRAGEGAPYTGLKASGSEVEPGIDAADKALEKGTDAELVSSIGEAIRQGIHEQFDEAMERKQFDPDDVEAGRRYINAYVTFIHYVERIIEASRKPREGHAHEQHEIGLKENH